MAEASPICRGKNLTLETVLAFVNAMPLVPMKKAEFHSATESNLKGWTQTHSQIARQLALYYEKDGMCVPRFTKRESFTEILEYIVNWAESYFVPNIYTPSLKSDEHRTTNVYAFLKHKVMLGESSYSTACTQMFGIELNNTDKLRVYLNNFTDLIISDDTMSVNQHLAGCVNPEIYPEIAINSAEDYFDYFSVEPSKNVIAPLDMEYPLQQIFYGAPGTGKSFKIKRDTAGQSVIRTTFHPDSDYSTFVGCYKPTMDEDITYDKNGKETSHTKQIVYSFVAQAFLQAYVKAWQFYCEPEGGEIKPQFLIIEEINRGNCAQIFGDLFQLLDRNSEDGFSSYPIFADMDVKKYLEKVFEDFSFPDSLISHFPDYNGNIADDIKKGVVLVLPSNFYIWATMNTSDQSLFPIDSAFKRRWDWKYIPIDTAKEKWDIVVAGQKYSWTTFLDTINAEIFDVTKSEDKKMGFYFCRAKNHVIDAEKFVGKVIFYIYNDVFKDYGFDRQMFENENGAPIQFHEYYKNDGSVNEEMVTKFLTNLKLNQQAEGKEENE